MNKYLTMTWVSLVCSGLLSLGVAQAAEQEYKPKVQAKTLMEGTPVGLEGKKVIIKHFTLPAGYVGGKHFHPGHVFVYVLDGELIIQLEGESPTTIRAGELYQEPLHKVMQGRNPSATQPTRIVVFQIGDADKPMMIKATP